MLCAEMEAAGNIEPDNATFILGIAVASVRSCCCCCFCRHCFAAKAHDDEVLGMARKFFMRHDTFCAAAAAILYICVRACVHLSLATFAVAMAGSRGRDRDNAACEAPLK